MLFIRLQVARYPTDLKVEFSQPGMGFFLMPDVEGCGSVLDIRIFLLVSAVLREFHLDNAYVKSIAICDPQSLPLPYTGWGIFLRTWVGLT